MLEWIERVASLHGRLNAVVTPAFMHRLDRRLLLHAPLFWRTQLHWVAWWSLLASAGLICCLSLPQSSATAWSAQELERSGILIGYVSGTLTVYWIVFQLRIPLGELPLRRHALLALLNVVTALLLFLPAPTVTLAATYRIATCISDAAFEEERKLHEKHDFWSGGGVQTVATEVPRIKASLARFGKADAWSFLCRDEERTLCVGQIAYARELQQRLLGIASSKELWHEARGEYLDRHVAALGYGLAFALVFAVLIGVASHPRYAWHRLLRTESGRARSARQRRRAAAFSRVDLSLLLAHPRIWAARIHVTLLWLLLLGPLALGGALLLDTALSWGHKTQDIVLFAVFGCALAWPMLWLLLRRHQPEVLDPTALRSGIGILFAATVPVPCVLVTLGTCVSGEPKLLSAGLTACITVGSFMVSVAIVRAYRSRSMTFLLAASGLFAMVILEAALEWWALPIVGIATVATALAPRRVPVSGLRTSVSAMLVAAAPAGLVPLSFVPAIGLLSAVSFRPWLGLAFLSVLTYLFYAHLLLPLFRVLARAEYDPGIE